MSWFALDDPQLQSVEADIRDEQSVARALAGAYGVVNAVSLYIEHGTETFHSLHVDCAQRLAAQACEAGVELLVHVSGIGADAASPSLYVRKRGEGELAVRAAFTDAVLIRPAVMFGPNDSFLTTIITLLERLPIYPMFGRGLTRLQPAHVEDVAEAIARALQRTEKHPITFECGGLGLLLRRIAQSPCPRSQPEAQVDSSPICRLAVAGLVRGNASAPADHPEPIGTDADRQCGVATDARIWRAWNFAALDRGNTSGDIMGSLTCFRREHWSWQAIMAALPPKADICGALPDVCFGPKADIPTSLRTNHCAAKMKALNMLDNAASKAICRMATLYTYNVFRKLRLYCYLARPARSISFFQIGISRESRARSSSGPL